MLKLHVWRMAIVHGGVLSVLVMLIGCGGGASSSTARASDVTSLFRRAVKIVRGTQPPTYARAVVLEADGTTRGRGLTKAASGIVRWRFVFDNQASTSRYRSATLFYGPSPKGFGRPQGQVSPFLEDRDIVTAPDMTLARAVSRLQQAGYRKPFGTVTLRNPLGPTASNPLYILGFAPGSYVGVNTVTGKVLRLGS